MSGNRHCETKENKAEYDRFFQCLVEGNQKWVHRVPVLILSVAKLTFDEIGRAHV